MLIWFTGGRGWQYGEIRDKSRGLGGGGGGLIGKVPV